VDRLARTEHYTPLLHSDPVSMAGNIITASLYPNEEEENKLEEEEEDEWKMIW